MCGNVPKPGESTSPYERKPPKLECACPQPAAGSARTKKATKTKADDGGSEGDGDGDGDGAAAQSGCQAVVRGMGSFHFIGATHTRTHTNRHTHLHTYTSTRPSTTSRQPQSSYLAGSARSLYEPLVVTSQSDPRPVSLLATHRVATFASRTNRWQVKSQLYNDILNMDLAFESGIKTIAEASIKDCVDLLRRKRTQASEVSRTSSRGRQPSTSC